MGAGVAAADALGWPDHVPAGLFEAEGWGRRLRRQALRSFALKRDLNRPSPGLSDLPWISICELKGIAELGGGLGDGRGEASRHHSGRPDMRGCAGRLRSSMSAKRRLTCRGTRRLCFRFLKVVRNIDGPASGVRGGDAFSYSSRRLWPSRTPRPIIFLFHFHPPNVLRTGALEECSCPGVRVSHTPLPPGMGYSGIRCDISRCLPRWPYAQFDTKMPAGTLTGQPAASSAAAPAPIRVDAFGRHERRNR